MVNQANQFACFQDYNMVYGKYPLGTERQIHSGMPRLIKSQLKRISRITPKCTSPLVVAPHFWKPLNILS